MKKLLLSLIVLLAGAFSAKAITPFVEFQPIQVGDHFTAFNFQGGITGKVHPNIAVGAGLGITERWNFDVAPLIPIFVRGELSAPIRSFLPFLSFDVGYEVNTDSPKHGAVLVNPMVGLKFNKWYVGIGYLGHCWTTKGVGSTSTFNMKVGYTF